MAERDELQKRYAYHEMSNKVEQADRSQQRRNRGEPTGEVETLRGRTDLGRMGDRIVAKKPDVKPPPKKKAKRDQEQARRQPMAVSGDTILDMGTLTGYQPSTDQARAAYESILTQIGSRALLGNQAPQVLRDAAAEVISALKDQHLRDPERQEALSRLLTGKGSKAPGGLAAQQFTSFVQLGKQLDDYDKQEEKTTEEEQVDDEMGVAVVFDESEDERSDKGDSDIDDNVVVDASSDDDSQEEKDDADEEDVDEDVDEEKVVQGLSEETKKKGRHGVDRSLSVHEIDAHFLQRQLSRHFDDADTSAKMADDVLEIVDIQNSSDLRECENRLLVLLGFDLFDTIKLILHNRVRVWACVALKRAQSEEQRSSIEQALSAEKSGEGKRVWEEIHSKGRAEDWSRERMKGIADTIKGGDTDVSTAIDSIDVKTGEDGGKSDSMEVDETKEEAVELDLETLAFRDGAHMMTAKTCVLPETSWKAMKKGYEEVHVPAVRSVVPEDEKLIYIKELPAWTRAGFKGTSCSLFAKFDCFDVISPVVFRFREQVWRN
jgi:pre-mRNA-splicing helicase BRR2